MPVIPFALQCSIPEDQLLPLKDSVDGCLDTTSVFNIPEFEYFMAIYPNGNNEEYRGNTMIFLQLEFKNLHHVYDASYGWGIPVCKTAEFFDPEMKFIVDGKLTLKINGIFKFETYVPISAENGDGQQNWIGGELGDQSWNNDKTKDFKIIVGDKEIKVHKLILGIRSEVFTAMLNANMTESKENKVTIPDFSLNVVETALKLIYECNFTSTLSMEELMSLLQFFDKYQLTSLKAKIEPYLIDQISPSTVCRLTNASIQTNSFKLKEKCIDFLSAAFKSQIPLADYKTLDKEIVFGIVENSFYKVVEIKK